jgi:hypothetical protein
MSWDTSVVAKLNRVTNDQFPERAEVYPEHSCAWSWFFPSRPMPRPMASWKATDRAIVLSKLREFDCSTRQGLANLEHAISNSQ